MANAAVATSMARMPCMGSTATNSAPNGGATIAPIPCSAWFSPATRDRCLSGTISEVEACIAGQWNAAQAERTNIRA